jgi:DNA polymerase-4
VYEKASIDEFYLDLTGVDKFFGCKKWSHELRMDIIKNTGLPISYGLSVNKTVAKIATGEAKPNGEIYIPNIEVKPFLHPLPIGKIPMIGKKTGHLLRSMGIITIGTLSMMPKEMLERVLGKNGLAIWNKANGIDLSSVKPYSERKSISTERTFDKDTIDIIKMNEYLCLWLKNYVLN